MAQGEEATVTESHPGTSPRNGMGSDPDSLLLLQPRSLAHLLTAEAYGAASVIPRPEVRDLPPWPAQELPPWQAQDPTQPGQISLPPQPSLPAFPPQAWYQKQPRKRRNLLKLLGVSTHFLGPRQWRPGEGGLGLPLLLELKKP